MSSLAQEESRSISENCTWGMRKRFADGKVTVPFGRFLGYDRGEDGNLVINEEQAKTVRKIYGLFLQGRSPYQIAKMLTEKGIPTPGGKKVWGKAVVESILTNEKYKGDALLQKVYTTDFLSKKKKKNEGEVPQYYVEGNHEAIIPPAVFDNVQVLMQSRGKGSSRNSCVSVFFSKIRCGDCGSWAGAGTAPRSGIPTINTARWSGSATINLTAGRNAPRRIWMRDEAAWYAMVDFMTVYGKDDVRFTFKNGMEIKA